MAASNTLTSVVTTIPISEVEENCEHILSSFFNDGEKEELSTRHIRSTAGWLVLKQALCTLLQQMQVQQLSEKDFTLKRTTTGRPYIHDINIEPHEKNTLTEKLFVSISHTRTTAYGMAVYQE